MIRSPTATPSFFTRVRQTGRHCARLSGDLRGEIRLINTTRAILDGVALFSDLDTQSKNSLKGAHRSLGDVRGMLQICQLPHKIPRFYESCKKVKEAVDKGNIFLTVTRGCETLHKGLSIVGRAVYKPFFFSFAELGELSQRMGEQWKVLCVINSGARIVGLTGKMVEEKRYFRRTIDIIFEAIKFIFGTLDLAKVPVHPAVRLVYTSGKCGYGLYKSWEAVA